VTTHSNHNTSQTTLPDKKTPTHDQNKNPNLQTEKKLAYQSRQNPQTAKYKNKRVTKRHAKIAPPSTEPTSPETHRAPKQQNSTQNKNNKHLKKSTYFTMDKITSESHTKN
jgi:hypothetical protein